MSIPSNGIASHDQEAELTMRLIRDMLPQADKASLAVTTRLEDLGFDSIQFIQLVLRLEEVVDKDLEEIAGAIDLASIHTVNDIVSLIRRLRAS